MREWIKLFEGYTVSDETMTSHGYTPVFDDHVFVPMHNGDYSNIGLKNTALHHGENPASLWEKEDRIYLINPMSQTVCVYDKGSVVITTASNEIKMPLEDFILHNHIED